MFWIFRASPATIEGKGCGCMKGTKAVLGLAACLLLLAAGCSFSLAQLLEANWGVVLPGGYVERFEVDTGASFHGDGVRYYVLEYADDAALREAFSWREEASATLFYGSEREAAAALLDGLEIPPEFQLPAEDCLYDTVTRDDRSELLLFWHTPDGMLYVVESVL